MSNRARLLLADDHALVLAGFRKLLEPEFDVVGTAEDGRAVVAQAEALQPDAVLLDISMPILNGFEAARQIKSRLNDVKIIFVTIHSDAEYVAEAVRAGATGYVLKRSAAGELATAISKVLEGGTYITPLISGATEDTRCFEPNLTPRQREVLKRIAEGKSTKEIAALLHISVKTVEFHKAAIAERLGVRSIAELTRYAIEHGIIH